MLCHELIPTIVQSRIAARKKQDHWNCMLATVLAMNYSSQLHGILHSHTVYGIE